MGCSWPECGDIVHVVSQQDPALSKIFTQVTSRAQVLTPMSRRRNTCLQSISIYAEISASINSRNGKVLIKGLHILTFDGIGLVIKDLLALCVCIRFRLFDQRLKSERLLIQCDPSATYPSHLSEAFNCDDFVDRACVIIAWRNVARPYVQGKLIVPDEKSSRGIVIMQILDMSESTELSITNQLQPELRLRMNPRYCITDLVEPFSCRLSSRAVNSKVRPAPAI